MAWPSLNDRAESRLRLVLLAIAVLASVLLPFGILKQSVDSNGEAERWVTHTAEVKLAVYELMYTLRDVENVLLVRYTGIPFEDDDTLYASGRERVPLLLDQLRLGTRDSSEQQGRLGALANAVEGRLKLLDEARAQLAAKNYDAAGVALHQARELFPFRHMTRDFIQHEQDQFIKRREEAQDTLRRTRFATIAAFLAQLILLGAVIFVSERQVQRRLAADKRASDAVEQSRTIVQNVREPILLLDDSLRLLTSNTAFREVYGEEEDRPGSAYDTLGNDAWQDPGLRQRLADVAARARELWDYELVQTVAGEVRTVLVNARRIPLPAGAGHGVLLTVNDISARKHSEERILELNRELEGRVGQVSEVNRELESFSYSVSHDLRAPLRHISGFADKLHNHLGASADTAVSHYIDVIATSARRMSALIEDLLLYSRLGREALRLQPVNMKALVEEVRVVVAADAGTRDIEWRIGPLPVVYGDTAMLRLVWQNLLGNAVKYTGRREHAVIEVGVERTDAAETVFFVRDNGTGFDMEYADKLFGVFQRLHKASEFPGTGIGLANVQRIVSRHHGRTWANATPGEGATFHFSLPVEEPGATTPEVNA